MDIELCHHYTFEDCYSIVITAHAFKRYLERGCTCVVDVQNMTDEEIRITRKELAYKAKKAYESKNTTNKRLSTKTIRRGKGLYVFEENYNRLTLVTYMNVTKFKHNKIPHIKAKASYARGIRQEYKSKINQKRKKKNESN
jgi:hypothetical protein